MKTRTKVIMSLAALGTSAWMLMAQDAGNQPRDDQRPPPRREGPGREGHRPPPPPVIAVLDANHDGVIDAQEIANASKALLQLDINGDGELTQEELCPPPPDGERGPRGPQDGQRRRPERN